jgi:YHS domain-containing protein
MSEIDTLLRRIDAEFKSVEERVHQFQEQKVAEYKGRQDRLEQFSQVCEKLQSVWRPRLEALAQRFGDKVKMQPEVKPTLREATFHFQSQLARIDLKFSATTDSDVRKLVLRYDLAILPILMKFEPHAVLEMPLDQVDPAAVAKWTDDRIIDFVKTYVSLHENQYYLKDYLVEDPIAGVRFPKYAAAAKLDFKGKTHYFISEETRSEFASREGLGADG